MTRRCSAGFLAFVALGGLAGCIAVPPPVALRPDARGVVVIRDPARRPGDGAGQELLCGRPVLETVPPARAGAAGLSCAVLGDVAGIAWSVSPHAADTGALNDLRNSAADVSANAVRLERTEMHYGSGGDSVGPAPGACRATYRGVALFCVAARAK